MKYLHKKKASKSSYEYNEVEKQTDKQTNKKHN